MGCPSSQLSLSYLQQRVTCHSSLLGKQWQPIKKIGYTDSRLYNMYNSNIVYILRGLRKAKPNSSFHTSLSCGHRSTESNMTIIIVVHCTSIRQLGLESLWMPLNTDMMGTLRVQETQLDGQSPIYIN